MTRVRSWSKQRMEAVLGVKVVSFFGLVENEMVLLAPKVTKNGPFLFTWLHSCCVKRFVVTRDTVILYGK